MEVRRFVLQCNIFIWPASKCFLELDETFIERIQRCTQCHSELKLNVTEACILCQHLH